MSELKLEDTKKHRFYWYMTDDCPVWLDKNMVNDSRGGINKRFFDNQDRFKEIGFDCPYNQLMRKCREKYYPIRTILQSQLN